MTDFLTRKINKHIKESVVSEKTIFKFENIIFPMLMITFLFGMVHVNEQIKNKIMFADIELSPTDAIETLKERLDLPPEIYQELSAKAHFRAFSVARLTNQIAIKRVKTHLLQSLTKGHTMSQWVKNIGSDKIIADIGFHEENPYYLETVFRTNANNSYNGGKWKQIQDKKDSIAAIEYIGIPDDRQTKLCKDLTGTRLPPDDPFWKKYFPPNHYNERSTTRIITNDEKKVGKFCQPVQKIELPHKHFRSHPCNWWKLTKNMIATLSKHNDSGIIIDELRELGEDIPILKKYLPQLKKQFFKV